MNTAVVGEFSVKHLGYKRLRSKMLLIGTIALPLLLAMFMVVQSSRSIQNSLPARTSPSATKASSVPQSTTQTKPTTKNGGGTTNKSAPSIPAVPNCNPNSINVAVNAPELANNQDGLQKIVETPQYYQVYGYTSSDVQKQILRCSPVQEDGQTLAASTNYALSWKLSYVGSENPGMCKVDKVAVGLRVAQLYPNWNESQYATAGYAGRWKAFMTNLQTHENGHRDLDAQYAASLYDTLKQLPEVDCSSFMNTATNKANEVIAALNQANESYDAQTNHGTTQGAVLPN